MKRIFYITDWFLDIISLIAFNIAVSQFVGGVLALIISIFFMMALNIMRQIRARTISKTSIVTVPGKFTVMAGQEIGVTLNGRGMPFKKGEGVEVKVPDTCTAISLSFLDRPNDDILDAKEIQ